MKVLFVNDEYMAQGGVEQYILSSAALLTGSGHKCVMAYCNDHPDTINDNLYPAYKLRNAADVTSLLKDQRPDIAYIHRVSSPEIITAFARSLPTVAYMHGFAAVCPGLAKYYRRGDIICTLPFSWQCLPMHYLRRCSAARNPRTILRLMAAAAKLKAAYASIPHIFVATKYMQMLLAQNHFAANRISILPPHFILPYTDFAFTPPSNGNTILFVGRLEIEKGLPYLLKAVSRTKRPVELVVAGDGTWRTRYEAQAQELKIADRVKFLGWLSPEEMAAIYRKCVLLALPSICPEAFSKAGIEALSYGRPVVAFDVGGVSDWLQDQTNGFLVEPTNIMALADKIEFLVKNRNISTQMGLEGVALVKSRFTADQHLADLLATFQAVM